MDELFDADTNENAVGQRVRAWARAASGLSGQKVVFAHPNAPRPQPPSIVINLINATCVRDTGQTVYQEQDLGEGEEGEGEAEGEEEPRIIERRAADWEWTYSIHVYGSACFDTARRMVSSLDIRTVISDHLSPLVAREPAFGRRGLIRRVPELVSNAWEERANFDLTVAGIVLDGFLIDVVETGRVVIKGAAGAAPTEGEVIY